VPYPKPIVAGLIASVVIYFCFLAWLHWKTVSFKPSYLLLGAEITGVGLGWRVTLGPSALRPG